MQRQGTDHERDPYLFPESGESPENIPETLRQGSGTSARQTGFGNTKKQPRDAVDWMVCMSKYVLKRLAMLIPVLIGVTFMVYFILSLSPGDTAAMIAGESADAETIEATRKDLGLDQPVIVQYGKYMLNLLHGDMGKSYKTKRDVFPTIMAAFPNTAKLAFWSILVAVAIALPIGIISATRQYSMIDNVGMVAALLGVATPNFWLGLMLIIVFSLNLGWLPSGGMGSWKNYIMPAITLGTGDAALICRMTRSSMLEVIR